MNNLEIYEKYRSVPLEAQKKIGGGRLSGMTDINPMWRIKCLTEKFGPIGVGWYYTIDKQWLEPTQSGETAAFCNITLYIKIGEEWSKGIAGTGGSAYIAKEKSGMYTDDECYKKALTDAISVACKCLGIGADIYWDKDKTKYDNSDERKAAADEISAMCTDKEKLEALCQKKYGASFDRLTFSQLSQLLDFLEAAKKKG